MGVVAVAGLSYGGRPLVIAFGAIAPTIGHALFSSPVSERDTRAASQLGFTLDANVPAQAGYIIVAVPTPSHASLPKAPLDDCPGKAEPLGCIVDMKSRFGAHALQAAGSLIWRL